MPKANPIHLQAVVDELRRLHRDNPKALRNLGPDHYKTINETTVARRFQKDDLQLLYAWRLAEMLFLARQPAGDGLRKAILVCIDKELGEGAGNLEFTVQKDISKMARVIGDMNDALSDGKIDKGEAKRLNEELTELKTELERLLQLMRREVDREK